MKKNITLISLMLGVMLLVSVTGVVSAATIFSDGFESGDFTNWDEADNDWHITTHHEHFGKYAAWTADSENEDDLRREVSTVGYNNIVLSYWYRIYNSLGDHDHVYVMWFDGDDWHELADYHDVDDGDWTFASFNLPSGAVNNPDFEIQFRSYHLDNWHDDKFMLDDVMVSGDAIEGSCSDCVLDITHPLEDEIYCENPLWINWTADGDDCHYYGVQYGTWDGQECDFQGIPSLAHELEWDLQFPWDTSEIVDGNYCVKVTGDCCEDDVEENFCIDCTAPEVDVCVDDGCCPESEGIESDEKTPETQTTIEVTYSDPENYCEQKCRLQCEIDWGDGSCPESCSSESCSFNEMKEVWECTHQYGDDGDYDITVTVTDCADNEGTDEDTATVENVPPTCDIEVLSDDLVVGLPIEFEGHAYDVDADMPKMIYLWNFQDGNTSNDNPATNIFTLPGVYNVALKVDDTDGGIGMCHHPIEVVEPIELENQETAVCECFEYEFETGLSDLDECSLIGDAPEGLSIDKDGNSCIVRWCGDGQQKGPQCPGFCSLNPDEDDVGDYTIFVKAENSEVEYYTFDLSVYDYAIHLEEGWNLISIPLVPENDDTSIDSVFAGILDEVAYEGTSVATVLQYDATEDKWYKARPYSDHTGFYWSSGSELTDIVPGYGYWIKMDEDTTLYLNGEKMYNADSSAYPPSVTLAMDSWNLVGVYGTGKCCLPFIKVSDALVSLTDEESNAYYDIIYNEDGYPPFMNLLKSKEGYWLSVKKVFAGDETIQYKANYYGDSHWFPWPN